MDQDDREPREIDWDALRTAATDVAQRAYAPYSGLKVGAAGLTDDGRIITGCNVENASYGLTLCAECGLVSALHASSAGAADGSAEDGGSKPAGRPRLVAVVCVDRDGNSLAPCGRCRQLLHEAGGPGLLVDGRKLRELLPEAFGPDDLGRADADRERPA